MSECACPDDGKRVPSDRRVTLYEPGAVVMEGNTVRRDISKVHIFDKECPVHGCTEVMDG